jgi:alpha-glucosidase (family GH31 glycosyl hydrolase)
MDILIENDFLKYKIIGGDLDFYFFAGPTAEDVLEQYTRIIGRPAWFSFKMLGFHQSRFGYKNLDQVEAVINSFDNENLNLDGIWLDIK